MQLDASAEFDIAAVLASTGIDQLNLISSARDIRQAIEPLAEYAASLRGALREQLVAEAADVLRANKVLGGPRVLREAVRDAVAAAKRSNGRARQRTVQDEPTADRPRIVIGSLQEAADSAIAALAKLDVYQRSYALADIIREAQNRDGTIRPEGSPRIRLLPRDRLRECLDTAAEFWKYDKTGELRRTRPPADVVAAVEARGQWNHVRPLDGVVEWPVLRPDGSVLSTRGYDAATRLICEPTVTVDVPDRPTIEDAQFAVERLRELVVDSPFANTAHFSAWFAALLTVLARPAIDGPAPLTLIDANTRGAGKTTLADLIGVIVTGRVLPRRAVPDDAAEWRKSMLAIAIAADPVLLIDNVTRLLASDALDAVLTGSIFRERMLGRNEELSLPVRTVFLVTANNATLSADLVRRSLHVRLESREEQPERRSAWQHPDVLGYARTHRTKLLEACFALLRAYVVAGRPAVKFAPMGSYDAWSAVIRAPLVWVGLPDPAATQEGLRESADSERDAQGDLLSAWHRFYGERALTGSEVLTSVDREYVVGDALALRHALLGVCDTAGKLPTVRQLGAALRGLRGQIIGQRMLERVGKGEHGASWRVRSTQKPADCADHADCDSNPSRARNKEVLIGGTGKHSQESQTVSRELWEAGEL